MDEYECLLASGEELRRMELFSSLKHDT